MAKFTDRHSREWQIDLDAPTLRKIKSEHGIDLVELKSDPIAQLASNPLLLADVAWSLCRAQAGEQTIDDFQCGLGGEENTRLLDAIAEAVVNFFPVGRQSFAASQLAQNADLQRKAEESAIRQMNDPKTTAKILQAMQTASEKEMNRILASLDDTEAPSSVANN